MSHQLRVLGNVKSLSNLTDEALDKIDVNIYSIGSRKMFDLLGEDSFDEYVLLQSEPSVVAEVEAVDFKYELLSYDARKLKNLELAEAYCILYYVSITLRKLDIDTVMTKSESWGEGSINPIDIKSILSYGDKYIVEAKTLVRQYSGDTGTIGFITI